jgi:hypothetical protein
MGLGEVERELDALSFLGDAAVALADEGDPSLGGRRRRPQLLRLQPRQPASLTPRCCHFRRAADGFQLLYEREVPFELRSTLGADSGSEVRAAPRLREPVLPCAQCQRGTGQAAIPGACGAG